MKINLWQNALVRHHGGFLLLLALVALSGLLVSYIAYENRQVNNAIQEALDVRNLAQVEWGKLLLESSTLSSPVRIETIAKERLDMDIPSTKEIKIVQP